MAFPGTFNFNYYRGDTNEFVVRPKNSNGESFNLTNFSANFTIANKRGPGATVVQYSATATVNTATNIITCKINPSLGRTLSAGTYVYDVQIINTVPDPDVILTVLTGSITVTDDVTGAI